MNTVKVALYKVAAAVALKALAKKRPEMRGPVEALGRYLSAKGEDFTLPAHVFAKVVERMFAKAAKAAQGSWEPGVPVVVHWDYNDYTFQQLGAPADCFEGKHSLDGGYDPLQHVVGGFSALVWYEVEGEGHATKVFIDMEDLFDFSTYDGEGQMTFHLEGLEMDQVPAVTWLVKNLPLKEWGVTWFGKSVVINDTCWERMAQEGLAKPYRNVFQGQIGSLSQEETAEILG